MSTDRTPERVDTLIVDTLVVTMDATRRVITDAGIAISGGVIVGVGKADELRRSVRADETVDGSRFVVTPGLINCHVHVTGETLTRGVVPDDTSFEENVFVWLRSLYEAHGEEDERLSAQLAAVEMLKTGTTSFLEAGTIWHVDAVVDGLNEVGIRAWIGRRSWDIPAVPAKYRMTTDQAIAGMAETIDKYRFVADGRIQAWPMLVGHTTATDDLWRAARELANEYQAGLNFHMSPAPVDPAWFLDTYGRRPIHHLDHLGVLADDTTIAHCVHVDDSEVRTLGRLGCSVAHCPTTALKVAYGVTQIGKMPEMPAAGVNLCIGTDGNNAANSSDLMRAIYLVAGLFKDARVDASVFPAEQALEFATLGGARALRAEHQIGSIEVGKLADLVLHDRDRPEWTPLHDVANQLVWSADGRSVHTVYVGGRRVVEGFQMKTIDESALYRAAQAAGDAIVARTGLERAERWPVV